MSSGAKLKAAREAKKLTLEEACLRTKIQRRTIEALEEDRLNDLLDPTYSKIFLKKYAIFLGLDPVSLMEPSAVAGGAMASASVPASLAVESEIIRSANPKAAPALAKWAVPALALLAALVGIGFLGYLVTDLVHNLSRRVTPAAESSKKEMGDLSEKQPVVALSKPLKLTIQTTAEVWMQVKADGTVVFQNVLPANAKETWTAKKGFELWTGNAGAMQALLNGKPLDGLGRGVKKGIRITHSGIES